MKVVKNKYGVPVIYDDRYFNDAFPPSEDSEAINFMAHVRHHHPDIADDIFHVANEAKSAARSEGAAAAHGEKRKQMGVRKGVADYIVLRPLHGFPFACIELKRRKKKGIGASKEQSQWLAERKGKGGWVCVAHGWEAALYALECYLYNKML